MVQRQFGELPSGDWGADGPPLGVDVCLVEWGSERSGLSNQFEVPYRTLLAASIRVAVGPVSDRHPTMPGAGVMALRHLSLAAYGAPVADQGDGNIYQPSQLVADDLSDVTSRQLSNGGILWAGPLTRGPKTNHIGVNRGEVSEAEGYSGLVRVFDATRLVQVRNTLAHLAGVITDIPDELDWMVRQLMPQQAG